MYGIAWSPADGSVWGSNLTHPGYIVRLAPGSNPPDTALAELYKLPLPGFGIRGMAIDRNGIVWMPLDSGHIGSFDRRKCKGPLNGPGAEKGDKCPEGFAFYPIPGPGFQGDPGAEENPYYVWVDQHNIFGLGGNVPIATATSRIHCTRWSAGKSSNCAFPIRWASSPKGSTAASTTRMPAGRAVASG
jgi:hypothetical protein